MKPAVFFAALFTLLPPVAVAQDGALLVADDAGNAVWKVSYGNP
jgi:hypothetical protein